MTDGAQNKFKYDLLSLKIVSIWLSQNQILPPVFKPLSPKQVDLFTAKSNKKTQKNMNPSIQKDSSEYLAVQFYLITEKPATYFHFPAQVLKISFFLHEF